MKIERREKLIRKNQKLALKFTKRLIKDKNIEGVVLFGSSVHGKISKNSDIDLLVYLKNYNFCAEENKNFYKILITINFRSIPKDFEKEALSLLLIRNQYLFYEDSKIVVYYSKILFDREGLIKKYYKFMTKLHKFEKIYLLAQHLREAVHKFQITKYYNEKTDILNKLYSSYEQIRYITPLLYDKINDLYFEDYDKNRKQTIEEIKNIEKILKKEKIGENDLKLYKKVLEKLSHKVIKKIKRIADKRFLRIIFKGTKRTPVLKKAVLIFNNVREFYVRLFLEDLKPSQFSKFYDLKTYKTFILYSQKRNEFSTCVKEIQCEEAKKYLLQLVKLSDWLYNKTKIKRYLMEKENYISIIKMLVLEQNKRLKPKKFLKMLNEISELYKV